MSIKACGIIVINNQSKKVLLIQQNAGHWSFPKGHQEEGEDELTTALREVKEETGLSKIKIIDNLKVSEFYNVNQKPKEVVYFLGTTDEQKVTIQQEEIAS